MKKTNVIFAIIALAIVAVAMTVVSCKKDNANVLNNKNESTPTFDPRQIVDMNSYLKDFKQRMQKSTKGDNEALNLEDAAWHLSSLANYDFGHANVELNDIRFDTLYAQINVMDEMVELNDMATAYESISNAIDKFFHSLNLENKHFRFIDIEISDDGEVTIPIITTFSNFQKWHFFEDDTFCDQYFPDNISYPANGSAVSTLQGLFNLILGKNTEPDTINRTYYVITRSQVFHYYDWYEDIDEYCPNSEHSRLYCSSNVYNWPIPKDQMCYYLDSYLGLAQENTTDIGPSVVNGTIVFYTASNNNEGLQQSQCGNHVLTVNYGIAVSIIDDYPFDY